MGFLTSSGGSSKNIGVGGEEGKVEDVVQTDKMKNEGGTSTEICGDEEALDIPVIRSPRISIEDESEPHLSRMYLIVTKRRLVSSSLTKELSWWIFKIRKLKKILDRRLNYSKCKKNLD